MPRVVHFEIHAENPERAVELKGKGLTVGEVATALGVSERTVFRYVGQSDEIASRLSASSKQGATATTRELVTFSSTATLTAKAHSDRAAQLTGDAG